MKKVSFYTLLLFFTVILFSCGSGNENTDETTINENDNTEEEVVENENIKTARIEELLSYLSNESTMSDCYIVESFSDDGFDYITVDFVTYKDIQNEDDMEPSYQLENNNSKLRTFVVIGEYMNCSYDKTIILKDLVGEKSNFEGKIYRLKTENGFVSELYIDNCSG